MVWEIILNFSTNEAIVQVCLCSLQPDIHVNKKISIAFRVEKYGLVNVDKRVRAGS